MDSAGGAKRRRTDAYSRGRFGRHMDPRIPKKYLEIKMYIARAEKRRIEAYLNFKWKTFCVPALREYERQTHRCQTDAAFSRLTPYKKFEEAAKNYTNFASYLPEGYYEYEYERDFVFTDWGEPSKKTSLGYVSFMQNNKKRPFFGLDDDVSNHFERLEALRAEIQEMADWNDDAAYSRFYTRNNVELSERYGTEWHANFLKYFNEEEIGLFLDENEQDQALFYFHTDYKTYREITRAPKKKKNDGCAKKIMDMNQPRWILMIA